MRRRVGLAQFMAIIAVLAVGLAAMKVATEDAARVVVLASVVALLVGIVGVIVRRERAAWVGFSIFGWGYLLVLLVPILLPHLMLSQLDQSYVTRLSIDGPVANFADWLHPDMPAPTSVITFNYDIDPSTNNWAKWDGNVFSPLTSAEWKVVNDYQAQKNAADQYRLRARSCATWIGLAFQGIAFAFIGASFGHLLSDRRATANSSD
jgi:hypothetical protein